MKTQAISLLLLISIGLVFCNSGKIQDQKQKENNEGSFIENLNDDQILKQHGPFFGSFISTTVSEIGDKTFIMTAILSTKYSKFWVFVGNSVAMLLMSLISCFIGSLTEYLLPLQYVKLISSLLFLFFGCKMLYEVYTDTVDDEDDEAEEEVEELEKRLSKIVKKPKTEDENESSEASSPEKQQKESKSEQKSEKKKKKLLKGIQAPGHIVAIQTFVSNFFGEWGDRSQISTVAISASFDFWKVFFGTILGQTFCTVLALIGGQILAKQFSEKTMALLGGILFLIFSGITLKTAF